MSTRSSTRTFLSWHRLRALTAALVIAAAARWMPPALAGSAAEPPGQAEEHQGRLEELLRETLANGLRVSILADPSMQVVSTEVWYHVGSANEQADTRGFAHLFEHLMFGSTESFSKDAYSEHHHRHGGYSNAYTSEDETVYVSRIGAPQHRRVLEMEADRMARLVLDEDALENEKRIVTEELSLRTENHPETRVFVAALAAVLGDHPYAITPVGTKEDIAAATLDQAQEFYERYYGPGNAHLVIVGPVDAEATLAAVRELFGPLPPRGGRPAEVPPLYGHEFDYDVELVEDLPPVETAITAFPLPGADSADHDALMLLAELVSDSAVDPFEDLIVRRRRDAVFATTEMLMQRRGGALLFAASFLPYRSKRKAFLRIDEARHDLGDLEWLSDEALESARRRMLRRNMARIFLSNVAAQQLGKSLWWHGDERWAFDRAARIERIGREDVERVWRLYVEGQRPIRVYLKPRRVPLGVWLFGWLYPLVNR